MSSHEGFQSLSGLWEDSFELMAEDWIYQKYKKLKKHKAVAVDSFKGVKEPIGEIKKFWKITKQDEHMLPAVKSKGSGRSSSASSLRSLQEEDDDLITDALKKSRAGLIYVKYFLGGANTKEFTLEGAIYRNIVDIFDLRKRLYNIKDIEQANFKTLLGNHMKEYRFGDKNDLVFHSNFDSGNLFSVVKGRDSVYYLEMTPDTNSTLDPGWFHFAVTNAKKGNRVVFRVINYTKPKFLNKAVCYRSKLDDSNPDTEWARLLEPDCSYYSNDEHLEVFDEVVLSRIKGKYTLEFIYQFEHDNDKVYFAPCPPYSYDDLQRDSLTWQLKCHNKRDYCFRKKLLCFTLTGRKLFYYEAYRAKEKTKTNMLNGQKIIILMARMHPSETASSFALQGFMEKLFDFEAGHKSEASFLRHHFMFVIIPMVNPDGVSVGNSSATFSGQSLKKTFAHPDRFIHPESFYIRKLIHTLSQSNQIMFYTDFRSSDYHKNCWIAGCEEKNFPGKKQREFPILMADWFKHFDLDKSNFSLAYKGGTLPAMLFKHFKIPMIFSLEISNYGAGYSTLFKQTDYIKIGQEYCDIMGLYFAKKLYVGPK